MQRDPAEVLRGFDQRLERLERDVRAALPAEADIVTETWEVLSEAWWTTTATLSFTVTVPAGFGPDGGPNSWRIVKLDSDGNIVLDLTGTSSASSTVTNPSGADATVRLYGRGAGRFQFSMSV